MRMLSDELVDNNLRDMHGTKSIAQSINCFHMCLIVWELCSTDFKTPV